MNITPENQATAKTLRAYFADLFKSPENCVTGWTLWVMKDGRHVALRPATSPDTCRDKCRREFFSGPSATPYDHFVITHGVQVHLWSDPKQSTWRVRWFEF